MWISVRYKGAQINQLPVKAMYCTKSGPQRVINKKIYNCLTLIKQLNGFYQQTIKNIKKVLFFYLKLKSDSLSIINFFLCHNTQKSNPIKSPASKIGLRCFILSPECKIEIRKRKYSNILKKNFFLK